MNKYRVIIAWEQFPENGHFYATIHQSARKTMPTARGHKSTGIGATVATYNGAVRVTINHDREANRDYFIVERVPWQGQGEREWLAEGYID